MDQFRPAQGILFQSAIVGWNRRGGQNARSCHLNHIVKNREKESRINDLPSLHESNFQEVESDSQPALAVDPTQ